MNSTRKPRRMARDPQLMGCEVAIGSANTPAILSPPKVERATRQRALIDMLSRAGGASLAEIIDASGWLPHTARAALSGLRKQGHAIERFKSDEATRYRIVPASAVVSVDASHSVGDFGGAQAGPSLAAAAVATAQTDERTTV
ncbi:DUF3489 domain-containing protein [Novosphingobium sp.]|uniref:DUF3489 domain-containing protein n=1 Tax=Novosphingobium sp. TaxID=1874826 RepID=UPI003BAC28AE